MIVLEVNMENSQRENDVVSSNVKVFIEILKKWRNTLWESAMKGSTAFLVPFLDDFSSMQKSVVECKDDISSELLGEFYNEFYKTIFLLYKCLGKAQKDNCLPASAEDCQDIDVLINSLERTISEIPDVSEVVSSLRDEDPTPKEKLKEYGFSDDQILQLITSKKVPFLSILDTEFEETTKEI